MVRTEGEVVMWRRGALSMEGREVSAVRCEVVPKKRRK